jgi:uncharacterized protein (DUF1330 family)
MNTSITLLVALHVHEGQTQTFIDYETKVFAIIAEYGGRLEKRYQCVPQPQAPAEFHLITFPSQASFEAYRADPRLSELAPLRQQAMAQTIIWSAAELPPFV